MKIRTLFSIALLAFAAVSIIVLVGKELKEPSSSSVTESIPGSGRGEHAGEVGGSNGGEFGRKLIVYYFHGAVRCPTCLTLEADSREAVETMYADELRAGTVEFQAVNFDDSWNKHFISDYNLAFGSLILANKQGQEESFTNLERMWELVNDKPAYFEYLRNSIDSALAVR